MTRPAWLVLGLVFTVVLIVLLVPGVGSSIEGALLGVVAGWAR